MERIRLRVPMRWTDVDAYGHVNNAAVLTLLEEARIAALWSVSDDRAGGMPRFDAAPGGTIATLVARQEIEYLHPLEYSHQPVPVEMWVSHLGGASFDLACEIAPASGTPVGVRAVTRLVLVDTLTGRPRRLAETERAALQPYVGEPPCFRWSR